jgi:hypothetical protein
MPVWKGPVPDLSVDIAKVSEGLKNLEPHQFVCFDSRKGPRVLRRRWPMVPIWSISPLWRRVALVLAACVVALLGSAGLGSAQERPIIDFQTRFSGQQVLPIFTQPQNRFRGALTNGSAWSTHDAPSSLLDPAPIGSLDPASSRVQPTNPVADSSPESATVSTDGDPDPRVNETASATKRDERTSAVRPVQRRDRPLRRSAAERRARPGATARVEVDNPVANPRSSRSAGARIRDRDAGRRSAEAGQLPSVLRLEDQPEPHPRDSLGTR